MGKKLVACLSLLALLLGVGVAPAQAESQQAERLWSESDYVEVIVVLDWQVEAAEFSRQVANFTSGEVGVTYQHALNGFSFWVPEDWIPFIELFPSVAYVERNQEIQIAAQTTPTGIDRIFAPSNPWMKIDGVDERIDVDVAVIDTGIDRQHPDLNVVDGVTCRTVWFVGTTCNGDGDDDNNHGTHVAGTIGALDNNDGVVGVAPGARLHAVKVLDSFGSGSTASVIAGIDWVAARSDTIEVANMSLGGGGYSQAQYDAIQNAVNRGVAFAVAAGNSSEDAANSSPASFDNVLSVSALADFNGQPGGGASSTCRTDEDDTLASFSNYGSVVDLIAPGVCILSTVPVEKGSYGTLSGTSMASPHAAGGLALLASVNNPNNASDVAALYSDLRARGNYNWTGDVDGQQEPLLDVSSIVPAFVSGGGGPTPPPPPPPSVGTYDSSTQTFWFWARKTITYTNPAGGSTSGTWSNGAAGGCTIPAGSTQCSFTSAWGSAWQPITWTAADGTVVS